MALVEDGALLGSRQLDIGNSSLEAEQFDLVMTDLVMPRANGIEVLHAAKRFNPGCPVIVVTGYPSVESVVRLVRLGATDYITKPFNVDVVKVPVAKLLEMRQNRRNSQGDDPPGIDDSDPQSDPLESDDSEPQADPSDPTSQDCAFDSQTGTFALDMLMHMLDIEIRRSDWRGHPCSLVVAAVDGFDTFHLKSDDTPDEALGTFARAFHQVTRPGDMVGRTGPAELAVILPETGIPEAESLCHKLSSSVEW